MGQKVNAIGLRLGVNHDWDSKWFAEQNYATALHKDFITTEFLTRVYEKNGVLVSRVILKRTFGTTHIFLHLFSPEESLLNNKVDKPTLEKTLATINGTEIELNIVDTLQHTKKRVKTIRGISMQLAAYRSRKYFNESLQAIGTSMIAKSALLLSKYLARQVENDFRHNQFIDFIKKALPLFLEHLPEVKGVRIQFKGRLNGSDRSKTQWFKYGQIPFHTIREKIDYGYTPAFTLYGACGIKVWICFASDDQEKLEKNASSKTGKV